MLGRRFAVLLFVLAPLLGPMWALAADDPVPEDILWSQKKLYSHSDEELIIRDFFQDSRDGFFVDIGCSHPKRNSNTLYLEKNLGWTGIGVDGLPDYAKGWKTHRPKSTFLNFLVTEKSDTTETFYKSPIWGLSTAEEDVAGRRHLDKKIEVSSITLDDLLERNGVKEIDLLSIDVEGHHESVLGGFDLARWKPRLVCIEEEGLFAVPWFAEQGYAPILRYRSRDIVNWYFAPKDVAVAVNARETEAGKEALRKHEAMIAEQPADSLIRMFTTPKYILDENGAPVENEAWTALSKLVAEKKAAPAVPATPPAPPPQ